MSRINGLAPPPHWLVAQTSMLDIAPRSPLLPQSQPAPTQHLRHTRMGKLFGNFADAFSEMLGLHQSPQTVTAMGPNAQVNVMQMAGSSGNAGSYNPRLKRLFAQIIEGLHHAPFGKHLVGKQINLSMVTEEELKNLGHFTPPSGDPRRSAPELLEDHFSLGIYDPLANTVIINTDRIDESPELMDQVSRHEFLHAFSTEVNELEDGNIEIRSGIYRTVLSADQSRYISREGYYVNEGLTEYLRVKVDGAKPVGIYGMLFEAASIFVEQVGEDVVFEAYFRRDIEKLRTRWDEIHGEGAFHTLGRTADALNEREAQGFLNIGLRGRHKDLMGFVTHGFEYYTMQSWGYSHEDRTRAPRRLNPSEMPRVLRDKLEGVQVFTNLSQEDLDRFFINANHEKHHETELSYQQFTVFDKMLQHREEGQEKVVFIRYRGSETSVVSVEIATIDDPDHPHFLGNTSLPHCFMSTVSLNDIAASPRSSQ